MRKKTLKKVKNKAEKENHGRKNSGKMKYRPAALIILGAAIGAALGILVSFLYFERQAKFGSSQVSLPDKQAKADSEARANREETASLVPVAASSSAIFTFSGTVAKVEGSKVYVDYFSCGKGSKTYTVLTTRQTTITKRENQQENPAGLADIKTGNNVVVQSFEDINKEINLTAREIKIMGQLNTSFPDSGSQK